MEALDGFNRLGPGWEREEAEELAWPGCPAQPGHNHSRSEESVVIRRADLENHNKDGGQWVVARGRVFDLQDWLGQAGPDAPDPATLDLEAEETLETLGSVFVGHYCVPELEGFSELDPASFSSPFLDLERCLGLLLGFHCNQLVASTPVRGDERAVQQWIQSAAFLAGGIQALHTPNPFSEEKGDCEGQVTPLSGVTPTEPRPPHPSHSTTGPAPVTGAVLLAGLAAGDTACPHTRALILALERQARQVSNCRLSNYDSIFLTIKNLCHCI